MVEAGRGLAACCIVGHHLTAYGEASDLAFQAAPLLVAFLYDYGRMAVQVFLVFSGFSLAWMLDHEPVTWRRAATTFVWRYLRLSIPYGVMLALLFAAAWLADPGAAPPLFDSFSWAQLLSHGFHAQNMLGYESFAAGMWYLSIDLQFTVLILTLAAANQSICRWRTGTDATPWMLAGVLMPLGVCAAWYWNLFPAGDAYVFYFLAPLVLGALAAWTLRGQIHPLYFVAYLALIGASLCVDFRWRLCIAMATATLLVVAGGSATAARCLRPLAPLGRVSYSLFLVHYLVNWLVLLALAPVIAQQPTRALAALAVAFLASLLSAVLFYWSIERPTLAWAQRLKA